LKAGNALFPVGWPLGKNCERPSYDPWALCPFVSIAGQGAYRLPRQIFEADISAGTPDPNLPAWVIYLIAFVTGAIVMSFEMLGSRYLNPYFGSGIYTWASLISTVLGALTVGYFIGGWLADRVPSVAVLGVTVLVGSLYMLALPAFAQPMLERALAGIDDIRAGSLLASVAILFFPVTFFGMYSPFAIRLMLRSPARSGTVSGTVYGISTIGSIVGTLGTTFYLLPSMGSRTLTLTLGGIGALSALALIALPTLTRRPAAAVAIAAVLAIAFGVADVRAQGLVDEQARAALLKRSDGRLARIETEYNDIFITKRRHELTMSFQLKGWDYTESVTNLRDPDDLPVHYTRSMTTALAYPETPGKILMIGLGGGSISTYLGRAMADVTIDTVEIDPGVINAAKRYFGIRENGRVKYLAGDGRVFLNRNKQLYDLILVDAYHGGYVPFHLLTKEFYALLKQRLAPGGAAAFNIHDGTKLYLSTIKTLKEVFPTVHLYPSGEGEVTMVATAQPAPSDDTLNSRAATLQQRHNFRYPLPQLVAKRIEHPRLGEADLLTDDFAPVNLYETMGRDQKRKK
jgi:spermidine synthase